MLFGVAITAPTFSDQPHVLYSFMPSDESAPTATLPTLFFIGKTAVQQSDHGVDTSLTLSVPVSRNMDDELGFLKLQESEPSVSRNRSDEIKGKRTNKRKRRNVSNARAVNDDQIQGEPIPSLALLRAVISANNRGPLVFLYNKTLKESDVKPDQNRLFVTKSKKLMSFMTELEKDNVVDKKRGLDVSTVDSHGSTYTLHMAVRPSLKMVVLNNNWKKLVLHNNAQNGDEVQVWGYRRNGELNFAVNFLLRNA